MLSKTVYAVQPYRVGNKNRNSLVVVIPSNVTKECKINTSTIFAIHVNSNRRSITLKILNSSTERKNEINVPGDEAVQVSTPGTSTTSTAVVSNEIGPY
jgi:hypothetical protein